MARILTTLEPDLTIDANEVDGAVLKINAVGLVSYNVEYTLSESVSIELDNFNDGTTVFAVLINPTLSGLTANLPTGHFAPSNEAITIPANSRVVVLIKRLADSYYWSSSEFVAIA